ncbi:N-acyl amino acid synthase FeeM domain-containing protein [Devosia sp.]|uniref:N-acyl amino acid synthase FeeM domain-containing protein n=1 Tax=Devosia sp. TaxID=1871048 RepID=UPI002FC5E953
MSAVIDRGSATSRFALTLIDLLDRVQYRRVSVDEQFDPVYRLRYEAYRREDFIPVNSQQITRDAYDEAPNCYCFGVYIDDRLVSSIRLHIVSAAELTSPSRKIWPDVLGAIIDGGGSYVDPSRFTADHDASLEFPALPYLTLRMAVMACEHFNATYCISSVRPEHGPFYKRVFGLEQMAGIGYWGELTFPVCLYGARVPVIYDRIMDRFPFFMSTREEREVLFGAAGRMVAAIGPTARQAHQQRVLAETEGA